MKIKELINQISQRTNGDEKHVYIFYTGQHRYHQEHSIKTVTSISEEGEDGESFTALCYDVVGPGIDTLDVINVLSEFPEIGSMQYPEKRIRGFALSKESTF